MRSVLMDRVDLAVGEIREAGLGDPAHRTEIASARSFAGPHQVAELIERIGFRHGAKRRRLHAEAIIVGAIELINMPGIWR